MQKIDYKQTLAHLYGGKVGEQVIVQVPPMQFLRVDGAGNPNSSVEFTHAVEALYGLSYTLKFTAKKTLQMDYTVMPLEGCFWVQDMSLFDVNDKDAWLWTMSVMQPDLVTDVMVREATDHLRAKKAPPALEKVRFERFEEGRAAQVMYLGAYADEGPTIKRLHEFIAAQGGSLKGAGKHHEIYLGDPRRCTPAKLKTLIRQPF